MIQQDTTLLKTLRLASNTTLNCQGHKLSPTSVGANLITRSKPEVAIFLNGAQNVQIQNCVIEGFDFGIFATKSKAAPAVTFTGNKIVKNIINANFVAISLASVDNTEISRNNITYTAAGGKGISVARDSDLNRISNNTITAAIKSARTQAVSAPGPVNASSNPLVSAGQAVLITQTLGPDPTLLNAIIEGELFQLPVSDSPVPNKDFTEDNIFEGNTIVFTQVPFDGIVVSIAQRMVIRNNTIRGAAVAIRAGIQTGPSGVSKSFPGMCRLPVGRSCLNALDCNVLGGTLFSSCTSPAPHKVSVFWLSDNGTIEGNTITTPFSSGIGLAGRNALVRGNTITGPLRTGATGGAITLSGKFPFEGATIITRNVVSGVSPALVLTKAFLGLSESTFGAQNQSERLHLSELRHVGALRSRRNALREWARQLLGFPLPARVQSGEGGKSESVFQRRSHRRPPVRNIGRQLSRRESAPTVPVSRRRGGAINLRAGAARLDSSTCLKG